MINDEAIIKVKKVLERIDEQIIRYRFWDNLSVGNEDFFLEKINVLQSVKRIIEKEFKGDLK